MWDVEKGFCTHNFTGHGGVVTAVAFHPDPHRLQLFSASEDGVVRVWDLNTSKYGTLYFHQYRNSQQYRPQGQVQVQVQVQLQLSAHERRTSPFHVISACLITREFGSQ